MHELFLTWPLIGAIIAAVIVLALRFWRTSTTPPKVDTSLLENIGIFVVIVLLIIWAFQMLSGHAS